MIHRTHALILAALAAFAAPAVSQGSPDEAVKKILETIDEELTEIDRLLMQTRDNSGGGAQKSAEEFKKLLDETEGSQGRVVRGIDSLIEQLQQMQQQSSGGQGQPQDQQQRSDDPLQDQEQQQRRDGEQPQDTSELRPGERPNGQKPEDKPGEQGDGSEQNPTSGQNRESADRPEDGVERVQRDGDRARWGNLQTYDLHRHIRGGLPQIPEKYRRFLEAYQKTNQRTRQNGR